MLLLSLFQELSILQDLDDARGECRAHGNLGAVHLSLSNYINAMKCYQEQLDKAVRKKNVKDYLNEFVLLDNYFAFFKWHIIFSNCLSNGSNKCLQRKCKKIRQYSLFLELIISYAQKWF